jgi:Transketolase
LNALYEKQSAILGGCADRAGSNNSITKSHKPISKNNFKGNYIHYGVREHDMCGIMNGLSLHSKLIPYGGTFLIFSDYCKPAIRLSALMKLNVVYVMTHDSIGLGEDGPTHQPIEQLTGLRSIPNLNVFRPADTTETIECWELALKNLDTPSVLALSRQNLSPIRKVYESQNKCSLGAYEIYRSKDKVDLTIFASGSEVSFALVVSLVLASVFSCSFVLSVPCPALFFILCAEKLTSLLLAPLYKI